MTWRRFMVMLRGLSSTAASVGAMLSRREFGKKVNVIEGREATQRAFVALFGRGKPAA